LCQNFAWQIFIVSSKLWLFLSLSAYSYLFNVRAQKISFSFHFEANLFFVLHLSFFFIFWRLFSALINVVLLVITLILKLANSGAYVVSYIDLLLLLMLLLLLTDSKGFYSNVVVFNSDCWVLSSFSRCRSLFFCCYQHFFNQNFLFIFCDLEILSMWLLLMMLLLSNFLRKSKYFRKTFNLSFIVLLTILTFFYYNYKQWFSIIFNR